MTMLSYIPGLKRLTSFQQSTLPPPRPIAVPPIQTHDVETTRAKPARTLKHLLKANHVNYAVLYHSLQYDNHLPHALCTAFLLGASADQLHTIYDAESASLEGWTDAPAEVTELDWRDFLGKKEYQRGFLDFFEDSLALDCEYDWKRVVQKYMFSTSSSSSTGSASDGGPPLINGVISGLGHPLIHLAYAYEVDSKEIAMEALTLASVQYDFLHKYTDHARYTRIPKVGELSSDSPVELLQKLSQDKRFGGLFTSRGYRNIEPLFARHEDLVLEYWNAWTITSAAARGDDGAVLKQFQESQYAATLLLVATVAPGTHAYNFFMVHLLTTSHAVRVLLSVIPAHHQLSLVRQWWLLTLAVYIAELRPVMNEADWIPNDLAGRLPGWSHVEQAALEGRWATDAHFIKAVRAMKEAAMTWGDVHERYQAAAVRFVDDFEGWTY